MDFCIVELRLSLNVIDSTPVRASYAAPATVGGTVSITVTARLAAAPIFASRLSVTAPS